jgi:Leucine-rich repeat (LRR) protein
LTRLGLTEIPELPTNIQRVLLWGNKIKNIYTLPPSLTILDVSRNELEFIEADLPESLTQLFVSRNKLRCLPYLPDSLEHINVSYNNINTLQNIPRKLKYLYCWDNPVPFELIESDNMWMYDIVEESHKDRIKLWKKFIKSSHTASLNPA